jgi:hypothetical protein
MAIGLAKIHFAEQSLGLSPSAHFISAPDVTITRNSRRWRQGFGYGGQVSWDPTIAVLDAKPNGCGMLVGRLDKLPDEREVRQADTQLAHGAIELDGVSLEYDLGESNHFVDVCELEETLATDIEQPLPENIFVIHSSGHEHRSSSPYGPGLYYDESDELSRIRTVIETPWGSLSILQGDTAVQYHQQCLNVQSFNQRRRALYGRKLFGDFETVCNATHQGMRTPGVFQLGCYHFDDTHTLFPLTLGPDQPVYLLRPRPNYAPEVIEALGWHDRAQQLGLSETLHAANLLPHGGGYAYPQFKNLIDWKRDGEEARRYTVENVQGSHQSFTQIRDLPFAYRDSSVLEKMLELQMADIVARYRIRFILKNQ